MLINTGILKNPMNWVFVAVVTAFVIIVMWYFTTQTTPKEDN